MSKYDPLTSHLQQRQLRTVPMTFGEIEKVLGFALPPSSRVHRAWWSNNPSNNVMTKAWLAAGYETRDVDIEAQKLIFQRLNEVDPPPAAAAPAVEMVQELGHPIFGALRGLVTLPDGLDPTAPADPDWAQRRYEIEGSE